MQYRELLHEWAWYFHEPKVSENAAHECNITTICTLTSVIKPLPQQRRVSSYTKYGVTHHSNYALVLIKARAHTLVARISRVYSLRARAITTRAITIPVQYRVILHGTGIGKYCCRNINWIINTCMRHSCYNIVWYN